ncbi:MAG: hypothetical protein KAH31_04145 [Candidatus Sabulitectum sp.]|nr:hypothetical protein [Candidatus Sabulitectum sp.]
MNDVHLVLSIPQGITTATSLGVEGLARHHSPGSGKHFKGRKILVDLAVKDQKPDFTYLDDGGWRDALGDSINALAAAGAGNRTKTALSNNAFSCTPVEAYNRVFLAKTGGKVLEMENAGQLHVFKSHDCHEDMSQSEVAEAAGTPDDPHRESHLYLVMCPIQLLLVSNLTPVEYAWYATHRPGKMFRQVIFTELQTEHCRIAAQSRFTNARKEIETLPKKKTKTIVSGDCINEVPFHMWAGYKNRKEDGLYIADQEKINVWRFPSEISALWERAEG